jgi:putative oxidoreductase
MSVVGTGLLVIQGLLGVAAIAAGGTKLMGADMHVENFDRFGYPQWFRLVVGAVETLVGIALLAAFVVTDTLALTGAVAFGVVLLGAVATHIRIGDEASDMAAPAILLILALLVVGNLTGYLA